MDPEDLRSHLPCRLATQHLNLPCSGEARIGPPTPWKVSWSGVPPLCPSAVQGNRVTSSANWMCGLRTLTRKSVTKYRDSQRFIIGAGV